MKMQTTLLLRPRDIEPTLANFRVRGALNPGAVRLGSGKIVLFARVAETPHHGDKYFLAPRFSGKNSTKIVVDKIPRHICRWNKDCFVIHEDISRLPTISHFRKITLDESGLEVEKISKKPDFAGREEDGDFGVEDARITYFEKEKKYAMTYVSVSMSSGVSTSLALSSDLNNWQRKGIIFRQQNKDVVIYPQKFNGYFAALHRPEGTMIFDKPRIWISYSKDLLFWGKDRPIMSPRKNSWEQVRIGAGTVPILTSEGWLMIYHGVRHSEIGNEESPKIYSAGAVLFDKKNPQKIIGITPSKEPLFSPEYEFEKNGFVKGVVFPSSLVQSLDKKSALIYCGAADSNIEVRKIAIKDILNSLS
ncbi:MAG TPA: hypothetical protein VJG83_01675 [archaeon]|nr:hypothetical protein [archaeon]